MKQNNVLILCIAFLSCVFSTKNVHAQSVGITAGVNFQNITGKNAKNETMKNSLVPKFAAGLNVDLMLAPDYYIQPGVLFAMKGAKSEDGATKINLTYVEIPVNFIYKPKLNEGSILLGFGPYVGIGIGGKVKSTGIERTVEYKKTITAADFINVSKVYFAPIDAGINFLAGYEFARGLSFQLNAQLGLIKINPTISGNSSDKTSLKNTGFGVSLGYRFGR